MKKKACKNCKMLVEGNVCPACKRNAFTTSWQGQINVIDARKSFIAKKINANIKGEYAIKVNR